MPPSMAVFHFALLALGCLLGLSAAQSQDPVADFCRRFGHQTTVVGRQLYIDGGLVNWNPLTSNPTNYTNSWLLNQDLDVGNGQGFPQLYSNLSKNSTIPDVSGGILWSDNTNMLFYQWGGQFQSEPQGPTFYIYDTVYNTWNATTSDLSQISRVAYGAGTTVEQRAEGYYYGGWLNNQTVPGWSGPRMATSNLIRYDMTTGEFSNNTGPDNIGRAEGVLVFIPASDNGLLIYFGGVADMGNGTTVGMNMTNIMIFDLNSEKWYNQTATGDPGNVPDMRGKFCAGVTWPEDQSSYNIYLYGGQGHQGGDVAFDDVYILTLPSFQWIKWYPTSPGPGRPHYDLTCNVIDGSQMLIIGGTFPLDNQCDSPNVYGTHNLNLGKDGPADSQWDLFYPNITKYQVPPEIISKVGGSASGGATAKVPAAGFDNRDLSVYFTRTPSFAARTATRSIPSTTGVSSGSGSSGSSHAGPIAGGVVGGVAGLALIIALVWFCLRRRRNGSVGEKTGKVERRKTIRAELPAAPAPVEAGGNPVYRDDPKPLGSPGYAHSGDHSPDPNGTMSTTVSTLPVYSNAPQSPYGQPNQSSPYQNSAYHQNQYQPGYQQVSQPYQQQSQYQQYDPSQDMMRQQHYPPPQQTGAATGYVSPAEGSSPSPVSYESRRSPPTAQSTPAHFYPKPLYPNRQSEGKRSPQPTHGRFIEEADEET